MDQTYEWHEYIARTSRGAYYYIGMSQRTRLITCGPKGYHWYREDVPACV